MRTFLLASCAAVALACNGGPATDPDCQNRDLGSCGVACCKLEFSFPHGTSPSDVRWAVQDALKDGGPDGRYALQTTAGGTFGFTTYDGAYPWYAVGQAYHTSPFPDGTLVKSGPYRDTINFVIYQDGADNNRTLLRGFSVSDINGALGDNSMNYKGIMQVMRKVDKHEWTMSHPDTSCPPAKSA